MPVAGLTTCWCVCAFVPCWLRVLVHPCSSTLVCDACTALVWKMNPCLSVVCCLFLRFCMRVYARASCNNNPFAQATVYGAVSMWSARSPYLYSGCRCWPSDQHEQFEKKKIERSDVADTASGLKCVRRRAKALQLRGCLLRPSSWKVSADCCKLRERHRDVHAQMNRSRATARRASVTCCVSALYLMLPLQLFENEGGSLIFTGEMASRQRASGRPCVHFSSARFLFSFRFSCLLTFSQCSLVGRGGSTKIQPTAITSGASIVSRTRGFGVVWPRRDGSAGDRSWGDEFSVGAASEQQVNVVRGGGYVTRPIATCCCHSRSTLETTARESRGKTAVRRGNTSSVYARREERRQASESAGLPLTLRPITGLCSAAKPFDVSGDVVSATTSSIGGRRAPASFVCPGEQRAQRSTQSPPSKRCCRPPNPSLSRQSECRAELCIWVLSSFP